MSPTSSSPSPTPWRPSITIYFSSVNLTLLCLLFPTISIFFFYQVSTFRDSQLERTIHLMQENLRHYGIATTRSLALSTEEALAGYDYTFLNDLLHAEVSNNPGLVYVMVANNKGEIIAHNQRNMIGTVMSDSLSLQAQAILQNDFMPFNSAHSNQNNLTYKSITGSAKQNNQPIPVLEIVMPVHSGNEVTGILRCGLSLKELEDEIKKTQTEWDQKMSQFKKSFIIITFIFIIFGLMVTSFFSRFLIRSTKTLSNGAYQVAEGDLTHEISREKMFCREFVSFSEVFNDMTRRLRVSLEELDNYNRSLEHKVSERTRELREAQSELLQQAHEAGMAEMAVGVLHNIGNAITPAKVDAALLQRRLRDSAIRTNLPKAFEKIHAALEHPGQLSAEDKQRLLTIIKLLPKGIIEEYDQAIIELNKICTKHEHIEGIICLQMRYARLIGEEERINLNRVVNDALTMLADSLTHRAITLDVQLAEIPPVRIEQAKMIQIVINLIKNGYEAMDSPDLSERKLSIATALQHGSPAQVVLSVSDTGFGFDQEEEKKLFQFGYTTKVTGSGFGLHSCANFLIAHNGTLSAYSTGKGQGAKFVVKLPAITEES
nr:hypothetical protein [Desulfobulbaceae bacterium]